MFTASTSDSTSFCVGGQATLNASVSSGILQWNLNGNPIPGATASTFQATQTGQYSASINNACGVFISDTIAINANPIPVISVNDSVEICEGSSIQLNASGATTYFWAPASGLNNPTIGNPIASPALTTNYIVTGTIGNCSTVSPVIITVHPAPTISVTSTPYDCKNGSQLFASGGTDYLWSPLTGLNFANIPNPVATPGTSTIYTVTVTNAFLCSASTSITLITTCDSLEIPTGLSPGDDGINDTWVINGLEKYPGNSISIYNRWGNIVFEAHPYRNDWQGKCTVKGRLMGETLPDGTYYFIIELGNGLPVKTGFLEIRNN